MNAKGTEVFKTWKHWCELENRLSGQAKNFHRRFQTHDNIADRVEVTRPQGSVAYRGVDVFDPAGWM
jgi:hypothetical protein